MLNPATYPAHRWTTRAGADVDAHAEALRQDGFTVVEQALPRERIDALHHDFEPHFAATPFCEGTFLGGRTKRFHRLLSRSGHARALVQQELILAIVEQALGPWCDRVQLNLSQAIEIHPGSPAQAPHRDQEMYGGPTGEIEYNINVMWPLSDYTAANGATLIWRGSNHGDPHEVLALEDAKPIEMTPGSALLWLGSTMHSGGANITRNGVRRGLIISYCLGWLKPYENPWLAYPPEIARTFSPELAGLVGYCMHRPNLGGFEGQCPSILLSGDRPDYLPAIDAMTPEQNERLARWLEMQPQRQEAA